MRAIQFTRRPLTWFILLIVTTITVHGQSNQSLQKFRRTQKAIPGQYIVVLNDSIARTDVAQTAQVLALTHGGQVRFTYEHAVKGFAIAITEAAAKALSKNPNVEYVEEDSLGQVTQAQQFLSPGPNTFFGIDRINQVDLPLDNVYSYFGEGGAHVYILDTGTPIVTSSEFTILESGIVRAFVGFDTFGGNGLDFNNHGTAVAGIIGGRTFGVAKKALLVGVKVCDNNGNCPTSNVISGLNWVIANHQGSVVANMSLSGPPSSTLDTAVRNAMASSVLVVAAAGNNNSNAANFSPARVLEALTVGATLNNDSRASYSNFGAVVDLYAPGGSLPSQGIPTVGTDGSVIGFDGTSAAAPHASGVAALYIRQTLGDPIATTYVVAGELKKRASFNKVTNLPVAGTRSLLYSLFSPESFVHTQGSVPFYRYYNGQAGDHFYTTNFNELGPTSFGWDFEFIGFYVFPTQQGGTVPLYQYWNPQITDHFYTITFGTYSGYSFEKIAGYVYPSAGGLQVPLYRYYNAQLGDHFYTTNFSELGNGLYGWVFENIECYVSP